MAMTLRLDPADEQALDQLAKALNTSRQRAAVQAIHAYAHTVSHRRRVDVITAEEAEHYQELLDRLGQ